MARTNNGGEMTFDGEDGRLLAHDFGFGHDDGSHDARNSPRTDSPASTDLGIITSALKAPRSEFDHEVKTPRTPGRVQFDLTPRILNFSDAPLGRLSTSTSSSLSSDDRFDLDDAAAAAGYDSHRVPLLTDLEAPSVTVAREWDDAHGDEEHANAAEAELRRPKSGLQSAFMNMANSIIGAGIIGQPYAMRQAGLLAGTLLLLALTVVVDWTICLIVINSKLSGTSSFQGTVQHCFGRPGLIAISVAQWVFAFGGMVAFGVIVGDTIPHVLTAIWTDLASVPVLGLLTDRRVAIAVFCMGISYPLTLYRDIAKVGYIVLEKKVLGNQLLMETTAGQGEHAGPHRHAGHCRDGAGPGRPGPLGRSRLVQHAAADNQRRHLSGDWRDIIRYASRAIQHVAS
jgi:sodium-coupled neutral amino acid transporter 11